MVNRILAEVNTVYFDASIVEVASSTIVNDNKFLIFNEGLKGLFESKRDLKFSILISLILINFFDCDFLTSACVSCLNY